MITFGFEVDIPASQLNKLRKEIQAEFSKVFLSDANNLMQKIMKLFRKEIKRDVYNSSEYKSLIDGPLRLELGIPNAGADMKPILEAWVNCFDYRINASLSKTDDIDFSIEVFWDAGPEFSILTKLPSASYEYQKRRLKFNLLFNAAGNTVKTQVGGDFVKIPWLDWLLNYGSRNIVEGLVVFGSNFPTSRTGGAIMYSTPGRVLWGVPPQFAGTEDDNFLTRSLESTLPWLVLTLESEFRRKFG